MSLLVKICGLKTPESVEAAIEAGADMLGFVFHPKSPRFVGYGSRSLELVQWLPDEIITVALFVNEDDSTIDQLHNHTMLQLHGNADIVCGKLAETPERVAEMRRYHGIPIMKAIGVASPSDLAIVPAYAAVADYVLLDAKPPKDAAYPGGHGRRFDWAILSALPPDMPFMLSGGLTPENVAGAIRAIRGMGLNLAGVDVSSGVESAPGVKDLGKIRAFVAAAREADGVG